MLGFVTIGTNNIEASSKFYDAVLIPFGIENVLITERYIGYAKKINPNKIEFYLMKPFNKKLATFGNGTMIALFAESRTIVDNFHSIAMERGALNEGLPGLRPPDGTDYYAYIRDADANKICAYTNSKI